MSEVNAEPQKDDNNSPEKVTKKFNAAVTKLSAVLGDAKHLKGNKKVGSEAINTIVQELLEEREKETATKVKEGLRKALDGYITLERELKAKRDELTKLEIQKKKEYTKTVEELAKQIEGIDELAAAYTRGLTQEGEQK